MANPKHLEILKQGHEVWNKWREENPEIVPDLSGENLEGTNFDFMNLEHAKFVNSELNDSRFVDSNLRYADLRGAELMSCLFLRSDLRNANLNSADLIWTSLVDSDLSSSKLHGAFLANTILGNANLSNAKGIDLCEHVGPSIIDHKTLSISRTLPINFLRGCGLSDTYIQYLPSLRDDPIQFYSCFISYSSKDQKFADRLYADLQNKGVRCWFAPEDLKIGDKTRIRIDESIKVHEKLLLILSRHSVESDWVAQEVETALERERKEGRTVLFPIRLDDAVMKVESGWPALIRNTRNIGDFRKWKNHDSYQKTFDRLLRDLKAEETLA